MLDGHRLVRDERRLDPDWQIRCNLRHGARDVSSESEDVAAFAHGDGEPDALMSIDTEHRLGRIGGPAGNVRNVAQSDDPPVLRDEVDGKNILLGPKCTRNTD